MACAPKRSVHARARPRAHPRARSRSGLIGSLVVLAFAGGAFIVDLLWPVPLWVGAFYAAASVTCFVAYAIDKRAAVAGRWRVSERTLLGLGVLGGWPGAIVAQQTLRHKTQKAGFRRAFWASVLMNMLVFAIFATPLWSRFMTWSTEGML